MEVDKKSYTVGETVELKGSVKNLNEGKNEVRLDLYNSEGKVLTSDILVPLDGNKFSRQLFTQIQSPDPGEYVVVSYIWGADRKYNLQSYCLILSPHRCVPKATPLLVEKLVPDETSLIIIPELLCSDGSAPNATGMCSDGSTHMDFNATAPLDAMESLDAANPAIISPGPEALDRNLAIPLN